MPLTQRRLKVTLSLPSGDFIMTESLDLSVRIYKAALAIQNRATIEVFGLTTNMREMLLTQFTAWHKRQVESGQAPQDWIDVIIEAGYASNNSALSPDLAGFNNTASTSIIFRGQVVQCEPTSGPPNIGVRITCYSRQIDKTQFTSEPAPNQTTFKQYVTWAAGQMGFGNNFVCETSYDDVQISNPSRSIFSRGALLIDIQNMYRPDVAAFVDDDRLIVKDRSKIINTTAISQLNEFIGTPLWTEWGATWQTLFDPTQKLAQAAVLTSKMNPGVNGTYVIMELEYDLTSRKNNFYVKGSGSPPA